MGENIADEQEGLQSLSVVDVGTTIDDVEDFIDMNDAVEIQVDDDLPMDVDDDDAMAVSDKKPRDIPSGDIENHVPDMSKIQFTYHTESVYSIDSFFDEKTNSLSILSGGGDDKAFRYNVKVSCTGDAVSKNVHPFPNHHTDTVSCVAYNVDYVSEDLKKTPRLAAVGSYDGSIVIYNFDTGEIQTKLEGPSDVEWISFHPKGGTVLLAGSGDGTVWMFHIPFNRCLQVFVGHEQAVTGGCFSSDGKLALSTSSDGSLRIWAPKTGMNKHVFRLGEAGLTCIATKGGTDGKLIVVGSEDGKAHVCHVGTKKKITSLQHFDFPPNELNEGNGNVNGNATNNVDAEGEEEIEYPMSVEAVGFSPSHPNWCATGGIDGKLKIWDLSSDGQCRRVCFTINDTNTAPDSITKLIWHPTNLLVFASTISGRVRIWDARNGNLLHTLTAGAASDQINDMNIQFLSNGSIIIVTASDDKAVRVFQLNIDMLMEVQDDTIME